MSRVAILSTAHIHSRSFCQQLCELTDLGSPYRIWDDDAARGQAYASEFGSTFTDDLEALCLDPAVEGFVITAENTRHLPLLEKALASGKPVMCEKPLTTTVAEANAVAALVEQHQTPLISGYFMPFDRKIQGAKAAIDAGQLGTITHVSHRNAHHAAYGRWFDNPDLAWFTDKELAGGGALLDLGTHSVHLLRTLFGPVTKVWASVGNLSGTYAAVDDHGTIMLEFASGLQGRIEASWIHNGGHSGLEVFGSEAALWQQDGSYVTRSPGEDPHSLPEADAEPNRIERLLALIKGDLPTTSWQADLHCCLDAVSIMTATYASAASGRWEAVTTVNSSSLG